MRSLWVAAAVLMAAGCGGGAGEVSGTVTFDGKPIEQGSIKFTPEDGKGPTTGDAIKDGKYSVQKVPLGPAKVSISGVKATGKKKMYDDPKADYVQTAGELLPDKYNSATELKYDVQPGRQTKNFDLSK
jgi:hypothetical protein